MPLSSRPQEHLSKENEESSPIYSKLKRARRRADLFAFPLMPSTHGAEVNVTNVSQDNKV